MFDRKILIKQTIRTSDHGTSSNSSMGECPTHRTRILDHSISALVDSQEKSLMYNTMATNMADKSDDIKLGSQKADSIQN